jgi:protein-L-isoaspartate(D-aspartate) O-methyltransferase
MIDSQLGARGIRDARVLAAMAAVPRDAFVPQYLAEFAYDDRPLPIAAGQTISQPYIVALMAEALALSPAARVLEIGTGSGYAAAVLAEIAAEVYTVERHAELASAARARLQALGYGERVQVLCGDGTLGWAEHAPYDAIVVAAGGPDLPRALLDQLAVGGNLVMPVGTSRAQSLVRITRDELRTYRREDLGAVMFVPLIGEQGWADTRARGQDTDQDTVDGRERRPGRGAWQVPPEVVRLRAPRGPARAESAALLIGECAEPLQEIEDAALGALLDRIGDARVVLLGEATHGTSEFYRMRAAITRELILRRGFTAVAVEADWPDAAVVDRYIRPRASGRRAWTPFARFPTWMWKNREMCALVEWLREYNQQVDAPQAQVSFSGLDLYSMYTSAWEVVAYLERVDSAAAQIARERYGCLTPWQNDPAVYGRAALTGRYRSCEREVVTILRDLLARQLDYELQDGEDLLDATQNARVVASAERYYRAMYYGGPASWNLRDQHMFDTLRQLAEHRGPDARIVVWAHNSHIGDAAATEMAARGEHNLGRLCRAHYGDDAYLVGFSTDHGTVAAAHQWGGPMEVMGVRPSHPESYERLCRDSRQPAFLLALRHPARDALLDELRAPRLERAIGAIYRPDSELASHYVQAVLPAQFDEYVWFERTCAVTPLAKWAATDRLPAHPAP